MAVTSQKFPGTLANESTGGGTTAWTNPGNAGADDTSEASWGVPTSHTNPSQYLKATNYGYTTSDFLTTATIDGFAAPYRRREASSTDNIVTARHRAVQGGTTHSANVSGMNTAEWTNSATESGSENITDGGSTNLWGLTWVATDIHDSGFGNALAVDGTGTTPDAFVDYLSTRVYYTPSTGATGTIASTMDDFTAALAGWAQVTGTIASTMDAFTAALQATHTIQGTVASTMDDFTAAFAGWAQVTGTITATMDEFTSSINAVFTDFIGTIASTMDDFTAAIQATHTIQGSVTATMEDFTTAISATVTFTGAVGATMEDFAASISGTITFSGAIESTMEDFSAAFEGDVSSTGVTGDIACTMDDFTLHCEGNFGEYQPKTGGGTPIPAHTPKAKERSFAWRRLREQEEEEIAIIMAAVGL